MSEGISNREILDQHDRQKGFGYLHNKYDQKKIQIASKMKEKPKSKKFTHPNVYGGK